MEAKPVGRVQDLVQGELLNVPAFVINNPQVGNLNSTSSAGLSVFNNPVEGNIGLASHEGDLGGAA